VAETANATPGNLAREKAVAASITTAEANALQALAVARGEANPAVSPPIRRAESHYLLSPPATTRHTSRRAGFRRGRRSWAEPGPFRNCECPPGARHALKSSNAVHGSCRPRSSSAEAPMAISLPRLAAIPNLAPRTMKARPAEAPEAGGARQSCPQRGSGRQQPRGPQVGTRAVDPRPDIRGLAATRQAWDRKDVDGAGPCASAIHGVPLRRDFWPEHRNIRVRSRRSGR
jgi:hypothetical protein